MNPPECHGHSHDHHNHGNGNDPEGLGNSLRPYINFDQVVCYNELVNGSGRAVLKLHQDRLNAAPYVQSPPDDPELLFHIPFTEAVTVHYLAIRNAHVDNNNGGTNRSLLTSSPRHVKIFVDREPLDCDTARELPATMTLDLLPPFHFAEGTIDYPLRPAGKFANISSLQIFLLDNYHTSSSSATAEDDDEDDRDMEDGVATAVTYLGLKGVGTNLRRQAVSTVYESRPMPADHKVPGSEFDSASHVS